MTVPEEEAEEEDEESSADGTDSFRRGLVTGLYLFLLSALLALFEIQIEGAHGWAAALPTWRISTPLVRAITGGRPIDGYHIYLWLLLLSLLHAPALFKRWSLRDEARVLAWFLFVSVYEDYLWFVWNPHFGLARYDNSDIWWYSNWLLGVPTDYFVGLGASLVAYVLGGVREGAVPEQLKEWGGAVLVLTVLTAAAAVLSL